MGVVCWAVLGGWVVTGARGTVEAPGWLLGRGSVSAVVCLRGKHVSSRFSAGVSWPALLAGWGHCGVRQAGARLIAGCSS